MEPAKIEDLEKAMLRSFIEHLLEEKKMILLRQILVHNAFIQSQHLKLMNKSFMLQSLMQWMKSDSGEWRKSMEC